jgi:hypothetical protein
MEKVCKTCGILKSIDEYYRLKTMKDGHLNICISCTIDRVNKHRELNIERIKEYDRNRPNKRERTIKDLEKKRLLKASDPEKYREQEYNRTKKHRANNPEKYKARGIINNGIRDGRIIKLLCSICGESKSQAHHDDYSKPLDVIWLCTKHHAERHIYLREIERKKI